MEPHLRADSVPPFHLTRTYRDHQINAGQGRTVTNEELKDRAVLIYRSVTCEFTDLDRQRLTLEGQKIADLMQGLTLSKHERLLKVSPSEGPNQAQEEGDSETAAAERPAVDKKTGGVTKIHNGDWFGIHFHFGGGESMATLGKLTIMAAAASLIYQYGPVKFAALTTTRADTKIHRYPLQSTNGVHSQTPLSPYNKLDIFRELVKNAPERATPMADRIISRVKAPPADDGARRNVPERGGGLGNGVYTDQPRGRFFNEKRDVAASARRNAPERGGGLGNGVDTDQPRGLYYNGTFDVEPAATRYRLENGQYHVAAAPSVAASARRNGTYDVAASARRNVPENGGGLVNGVYKDQQRARYHVAAGARPNVSKMNGVQFYSYPRNETPPNGGQNSKERWDLLKESCYPDPRNETPHFYPDSRNDTPPNGGQNGTSNEQSYETPPNSGQNGTSNGQSYWDGTWDFIYRIPDFEITNILKKFTIYGSVPPPDSGQNDEETPPNSGQNDEEIPPNEEYYCYWDHINITNILDMFTNYATVPRLANAMGHSLEIMVGSSALAVLGGCSRYIWKFASRIQFPEAVFEAGANLVKSQAAGQRHFRN